MKNKEQFLGNRKFLIALNENSVFKSGHKKYVVKRKWNTREISDRVSPMQVYFYFIFY